MLDRIYCGEDVDDVDVFLDTVHRKHVYCTSFVKFHLEILSRALFYLAFEKLGKVMFYFFRAAVFKSSWFQSYICILEDLELRRLCPLLSLVGSGCHKSMHRPLNSRLNRF